MRTLKLALLGTATAAAALAFTACNSNDRLASPPGRDQPVEVAPPMPPPETGAVPSPSLPPGEQAQPGRSYDLRMSGVNAGAWAQARIPVKEVQVLANGVRLPVEYQPGAVVDLALPNHAALVGRVWVPDSVEDVAVTLVFDDGGTFTRGVETGVLASRVAPVQFTMRRSQFASNGHAVLDVDVERSLLSYAGERILLPRLTLRF
jgi:hypothetical protein